MGRPNLTLSVRRLMIAVAIPGLVLPPFLAFVLNQKYHSAAASHCAEAAFLSLELKDIEILPPALDPQLSPAQKARIIANEREGAGGIREQRDYDERVGRMFERAASRPLSPLPPDPGPPG